MRSLLVGILAVFVLGAGFWLFREHHVKAKAHVGVASVKKDIQEHLSVGSSRADVRNFLDLRKTEHSHIGDAAALPQNEHTEIAIIRDVEQKGLVKGDIQMTFKFDKADSKLVSWTVREIFTGP